MNDSPDATDLAESRTNFAEDRTVLANERTFAGWMRTGLVCVGIDVGFHVMFGKLEPDWLARAIATLFVLVAIAMIVGAVALIMGIWMMKQPG